MFIVFPASLSRQFPQVLAVGQREMLQHPAQCSVALQDQRITQFLEQMEGPRVGLLLVLARGDGGPDGRRIGIAHQLADVLQLAAACTVGMDLPALQQGIEQFLRQIELLQFIFAELQQLAAQILQRFHITLAAGLAGFGGLFVFRIVHCSAAQG